MLIKALTGGGAKTARSHFIFEKGGKLVEKRNPVKPADRYAVLSKRAGHGSHSIFPAPSLPSNSSRDWTRTLTQWLWMLPQIRKSTQLRMLLLQKRSPQRQRKRKKLELSLSLETSLTTAFNSTILFSVVCRRIAVMDNYFGPYHCCGPHDVLAFLCRPGFRLGRSALADRSRSAFRRPS